MYIYIYWNVDIEQASGGFGRIEDRFDPYSEQSPHVSTRFFITSPSFPPFQMKLRHPTSLLIVSISLSQMIFIAQKLTVLFRRLRVHVMGNLAVSNV